MGNGTREKAGDYDVIIVGAGSAALGAAVAARESGAERVLMLEKAPATEAGGNARFSHTGFRFIYSGIDDIRPFLPHVERSVIERMHVPPYTVDDFVADLQAVTDGRINPALARVLAEESGDAVRWMFANGIPWDLAHHVIIKDRLHFEPGIIVHPMGGGLGQLRAWNERVRALGVEIRYESSLSGLLGTVHRVEGVRVTDPNSTYELRARSVILCAGGFQANREMRAQYLEGNADFMKVRGSRHNTGEVLRTALDLGARAAGHWKAAHATPIDGGAPDFEVPVRSDGMGSWTNRYYYMYGITVNKLGVRFYDEGESHQSYTYAKTGKAVLDQPGGVAYQIYDQRGIRLMKTHAESHLETKYEANSIPELAKLIGVDPAALTHTVQTFNAATDTSRPFDPTVMDGRATKGLTPPKSNWATAIEEGPFRAYPITCGITFTFGGLEINPNAQVMSISGQPIPGLYATGDIVGLFFHNYPSCTGQTRNAVFGRRAGRHAVMTND